ncbi:TrkH family potassium uptake protein [Phascolarctobacterium succinatutens]|uniref:TrkH family potassium uptake protein n=1 Tax=Phascolarctobacterium succinatutens TaxID=626940 RepID=UPI0026EA381C|nr:TrkH family potassium uptake protein [Phascolarctobacterium succinatutens]
MDSRLVNRLLAKLTIAFSCVLLVPLIAALLADREHIWIFIFTLITTSTIASLFNLFGSRRPRQRLRVREAIAVVGCGWLLVCLMGALPYLFLNPADPIAAVFESVSGFSTTGVTTALSFNDFPPSIRVWRCLTHWTGGIGVIMLFIIIMPQMNSGTSYLFNAELPGGTAERTLPKIKESAMMILLIYVILTAVEVALLLLAGLPIFQALNLALATMATGGFSYYHDSLISFRSVYVEIIAIVFMLIASMNFSLYYKIWRGDWASVRQDSEHRYYLLILTTAAALICSNLYFSGYMDFNGALRHSIFQAVSIGSTTGYASDDYNNWPSFSRSVLLMLMFIGGCSGSTAGGIKITRLVILLKAGWAELLRTLHPRIVYSIRMGEREINPIIVGNITRFFFLYILVFIVLTILISLSGIPIMESMGLIAACMSSVGPAFGIVGPTSTYNCLSDWARFISIWAMILGRLEIFTLLVIMRPDFWRDKQNW